MPAPRQTVDYASPPTASNSKTPITLKVANGVFYFGDDTYPVRAITEIRRGTAAPDEPGPWVVGGTLIAIGAAVLVLAILIGAGTSNSPVVLAFCCIGMIVVAVGVVIGRRGTPPPVIHTILITLTSGPGPKVTSTDISVLDDLHKALNDAIAESSGTGGPTNAH
jgi:hypothetical protein